jgi:hypothetical protein
LTWVELTICASVPFSAMEPPLLPPSDGLPRSGDGLPRSGDGLLGGRDLLARLDRWLADVRSDDAAAARARERCLRVAAEESATFAGVLVDLAERSTPVLVHARAGRRHRGMISAVGVDFCALHTAGGRDVLISSVGISSVRPEAGAPAPSGDRVLHLDLGLAEALAVIAADRPRVLLVTIADADGIAGELRSVGRDVATVRLDGGAHAYVAIAAIAEVSLVE